jgi:hypothetical protein
VFAALPALAQNNKDDDPDLREIEHYTLSMENVTRMMDTLGDLMSFAKSHPEQLDALSMDEDKNRTLDEMAKSISAVPVLAEAVRKHGFTPKQFALEEMTLMQAMMGEGLKPTGQSDAEWGKKTHVNPANLAFIREHKDEIAALQKKYMPNDADGDDSQQ